MDNQEIVQMNKQIKCLIRCKRLEGKYIVLFGASPASKEIKKCLMEEGICPDAIVDNDSRKIGRECMGLIIQKPEALLSPFRDSVVILLSSVGFSNEKILQLTELGYSNHKHIFCFNLKNDESIPVLAYHTVRMFRGLFCHRRLVSKYSDQHVLFLAPYTGTGDIYLVGLFFHEYVKRNHISNYIFVVVSGACRQVANMFDIKNIEIISQLEVDDIINCDRVLRTKWPILVLNDSWVAEYTNSLQWIRGYNDLSFDKMFRYFVFDFDDHISYQLPTPRDCSIEVKALFEKYDLKETRTVVLSPYSNTLFELPDEVWHEIVKYCKEQGYTVCTNCAGAGEQAVEGTVGVFFPIGQAIEFMNKAGFFIGVRSGLCDIISSSHCKKIILYEKDGFFYKSSSYEYFSLRKMEFCSDVIELEYRSDLKIEFMDQIRSVFS